MERTADEEELERVVGTFRARKRNYRTAVILNTILLLAGLGVPYVRGRLRAREVRERFAAFSACLLDGEALSGGGIGMPRGYERRLAAQYLGQDLEWPTRCYGKLEAVAPPEVTFLWPAVKRASADARATVKLMHEELDAMRVARNEGRDVPARPLRAFEKMRAAQTLLAQAAGTADGLDDEAVRFDETTELPAPTRLPLHAASKAQLQLWESADGLHALAVDRGGISLLRVQSDQVERTRVRRTGLVRTALPHAGDVWLVWATPQARCSAEPDGCAHRATGIAELHPGDDGLPAPRWVAAHPVGDPEQSIRFGARRGPIQEVEILAHNDGALELRRFEVPDVESPDAPPLSPSSTERFPTDGALIEAWRLPAPTPMVLSLERASAGVQAAITTGAGTRLVLPGATGASTWSRSCRSSDKLWTAYGDELQLFAAALDVEGDAPRLAHFASAGMTLKKPAPGASAGAAVWVGCTAAHATLVYLDESLDLLVRRCGARGCTPPKMVARQVAAFAAAASNDGDAIAVAYSGGAQRRQIRVRRVDSALTLSPAVPPGACVEENGGLCGTPALLDMQASAARCAGPR